MAKSIATIEGTALVPGVSKNGRYYSKEAIAKAVARLSERLADGANPAVMLTSHGADDDSRCIVGLLDSMSLADDGSARFSARIADTDEGRKIASLVDTRDGPAFLKGVSIRGAWVGNVRTQTGPDGTPVTTADDLEISGLDFTHKPGVPGAKVDTFIPAEASAPAETASDGRVLITESVQEALVTATIEEADAPAPATDDGPFADPGYQADKKKRYPLSSKAQAKSAWSYINKADNARLYTSAQLKRVKGRIMKALKGFGVTVAAQEGWLIDPAVQVTETLTVAECLGYSDDPGHGGSMCVTLTNGPTTVTVSSYCVDPHDLDLVGRSAMAGACQAIAVLDPDMDADIDVPGADAEDTDDDTAESAIMSPAAVLAESAAVITPAPADALTQTSAPEPPAADTTSPEEEPAMAEPITAAETAAAPAAGGVHFTDDQFAQFLDRLAPAPVAAAPVEAAPAVVEPVAETAPVVPPVEETQEQLVARLVEERLAAALPAAIQENVERNGPPARKGVVPQLTEHTATVTPGLPEGAPSKPLHEYTDEEWREHIAPAVVGAVLKNRTVQPSA